MPTEDQPVTLAPASVSHTATPAMPKLVSCPFVVLVNGEAHDSYYDVRDAVFAARELQRAAPGARVKVTDTRTGKLKIKLEE